MEQSEVENRFYVKSHSLRREEMLNGLNQVKGLEQHEYSINGVNNVNMHTT